MFSLRRSATRCTLHMITRHRKCNIRGNLVLDQDRVHAEARISKADPGLTSTPTRFEILLGVFVLVFFVCVNFD